jgi:hypothetical protein|eukprot:COSAG01_NODE_8710_length_2681_cov_4.165251_4_plen_66_part_00
MYAGSCCTAVLTSTPVVTRYSAVDLLALPTTTIVLLLLPLFTPTCILTETRSVKAAFRLERQLQR